MARHDLSDFEGSIIEPLSPNTSRGVPRVDDRRLLNDIQHGEQVLAISHGFALGGYTGVLWAAPEAG